MYFVKSFPTVDLYFQLFGHTSTWRYDNIAKQAHARQQMRSKNTWIRNLEKGTCIANFW